MYHIHHRDTLACRIGARLFPVYTAADVETSSNRFYMLSRPYPAAGVLSESSEALECMRWMQENTLKFQGLRDEG